MNNEFNEETKLLIKSSLNIEANILNLGLEKWGAKLKKFEREYGMSSSEFLNRFNKGELGDDKKWFEWLFAYRAYEHIKKKLQIMKSISL